MMVEGTVVKVDCPHCGNAMIHQDLLGVDKARCIFIDAHPGPKKLRIIRATDCINQFFVRDSR